MPQPTSRDVHVDVPLTNMSVAYMQSEDAFIATKVFPLVPVEKKSDKYYEFTKNDWFRDEAQRRGPSSESAGGGYNQATNSYSCDTFAFHKDVDYEIRKNYDQPLDPDRNATQFVTRKLLLRQEAQWVTDYFTTGVWATDKVGTTDFVKWSDFAGSDPIEDIEAGKEAILSTTGFEANTLVLGYQAFRRLKRHPDIVDLIKYTNYETITPDLVARLLDIEKVLVAKAVKATNVEGETAAYSFSAGKNAWLGYVNPAPAIEMPSAGYVFAWTGVSDTLGESVAMKTIEMPWINSDRIEGEAAWDNKVIGSDLGYFFSNAVA